MKTYTMLFVKNKDTIKAIEPIVLTQYNKIIKTFTLDLRFKCLKKRKFTIFSFSKNINDSIHRFLKNAV